MMARLAEYIISLENGREHECLKCTLGLVMQKLTSMRFSWVVMIPSGKVILVATF
jgi:hypothetical protein